MGRPSGLRWFRDRTTCAALARDHGITRATTYRYRGEVIIALAEQSPQLSEALDGPQTRAFHM